MRSNLKTKLSEQTRSEPEASPAASTDWTWHKVREQVIKALFFMCAGVSVLTTLAITWILVSESVAFLKFISVKDFLLGTQWYPLADPGEYGVLPLVCGTTLVALGACLVAVPIGLLSAIYLSEYASDALRRVLKPSIELLAGIPTVVYGYFALSFVTPALQKLIPQTHVFNALSACIVVGVMIIPTIAALSDDALRAVPKSLRFAAFAVGATKFDVSCRVVFPAALSGIVASIVLAISRAIGETMAVTLAAGATPRITLNPLESIQTMTSYIVQVSLGDTPDGTIEYQSIFAVGLLLFIMTFLLNVVAQAFLNRFRERYE